jgi:hypothetical protein
MAKKTTSKKETPWLNNLFLDGRPLDDNNPPNLNQVMNAPTESFNKFKPNSVLAYNPYEKTVNTVNPSAYVRPNYYPQGNNYKYGFLGTSEGNIYGGAGYGIPKYGLEGTVFGTTPSSKNPYFKGFYNAGISKQFENNKIGLSVGAPVTGYTDETGFNANKLELQPQVNFKRTFLDGGPLVDKTNHGKLLNSVYASTLGNYYANGGQFTRPYSLPEDSFKQGGNNLHNSVYASSMEQYPAVYEYGGPMSHFYASNVEEPATIGKDLAYNNGGTMNPIHINPENKGKFNATKARTGKTTEELTHSSNPLTRKRAIFAQNASRWNHQYGGYMFAEGGNLDPLTTFDEGGSHAENPLIYKLSNGQVLEFY